MVAERCAAPHSSDPAHRRKSEVLVGRGGIEPPTFRFSGGRSYRLSYLPAQMTPF